MGISENTQRDRVEAVVNYIQELLSDMVTDEEILLKELIKNTERYKKELLSLAQVLGLPPYEVSVTLYMYNTNRLLCMRLSLILNNYWMS